VTVLSVGLLVAAVLTFFIGVSLVVVNITTAVLARAGVARGLSSIHNVYSAAAVSEDGERVGPGVSNRLTRLGRAATPRAVLAQLRRRLDYAGNPPYWTVERLYEVKAVGLFGGAVLGAGIGLLANGLSGLLLGGVIGAPLGFFGPDIVLYDVSERRQDRIRRTMPDILDVLTVSVEAGLGFDAALAQITRYGRGPLAGEFARVLQEMQIGRARVDALRALASRTSVSELKAFCAIVVQASELGVPIANVLREQAREMRIRRRQRAEELAQKVPVKILFPLIFCLFPALFIVVLGPGVINILHVFR
jgi:tight adherence protein C